MSTHNKQCECQAEENNSQLENKIDKIEMLLNELKKENDRFKQMINSKAKDSEEIVQVQETI